MAYLNLPTKKKKSPYTNRKRQLRQKLYHIPAYRKKVDWYKKTHVWCCKCLDENKYVAGVHLHHVLSPFDDKLDDDERLKRLMDESNWQLLCVDCHENAHNPKKLLKN